MTTKRKLIWGYVITVGWLLAASHVKAETTHYAAQEEQSSSPEDLIKKVPILNSIPRTFLFGDGYKMKISGQQLLIDHQSRESRLKTDSSRTCMIGFSYTAPIGNFIASRIDLPIFSSPTLAMSDWSRNSIADYQVYLSHTAVDHPTLKIALNARF